jgi:hypothetical protein
MMEETKGLEGYGQISELKGKGFRVDSNDPDTSDAWSVVVPPTKCCGRYFIGDSWTWSPINE